MKKLRRTHSALNLPTLRLEGHLLLPDQLEKAALGLARHQEEIDYHTPKGLKLKDDYSRAFQIACAQWKHFEAQLERHDADPHSATANFVQELLRDAFGYHQLQTCAGQTLDDRQYPIPLMSGRLPVVVAPHTLALDTPDERFAITGSGSRRKSAFQLAQEFLNSSPDCLWALVSNGRQLRLLRDAATLTRPSYLEFDLQDMLGAQRFAEFAMAWRLLHASRAGDEQAACIWERWRSAGQEEGTRVREGLRKGVTAALLTLGAGFLQHRDNDVLRQALHSGELDREQYFQQLLRLVYRLIFLFTVEERGLLHPVDDIPAALAARRAYASGYALANLRELCLHRRARNQHADRWDAQRIVFRGLAKGETRLALPALGGLFAPEQCLALDQASLSNEALLLAVRHLRWADSNGSLTPVDYRNMGPEELGSVYESLLEQVPELDLPSRHFGFAGLTSDGSTQGNARKTSGSYYTPDSLVQELIKSALDPVIEQRIRDNPANPTAALLSITVVDPACGSGHFLLAAARRLAERLAALRSPEGAVKPEDYRHALREVISHCIFGVDRNPMALELCRMALWLEGFEEGRPLSFLDHHLQCGDALLGLSDLSALEQGIPAAAFKPLSGDDPTVCRELAKANKQGLKALQTLRDSPQHSLALEAAAGLHTLKALEILPEATPADIAKRASAWQRFVQEAHASRLAHAADLLLGAFLLTKTDETAASIPTSQTLYLELCASDNLQGSHNTQQQAQLQAARAACAEARVLHWPLAFPQVFQKGGFDCVLGNPPWERIKLQEEEFFATRNTLVAEAKNKAERSQRIAWLSEGALVNKLYPKQEQDRQTCVDERRLYEDFLVARRMAEAASVFAHVKGENGGRYPLTGVGDVNTYALFAETIRRIVSPNGRAGFLVPSGLVTDNSTKYFFWNLIAKKSLDSFFELENEGFFPDAGQGHMLRFALTTIVGSEQQVDVARFIFQAKKLEHLRDYRRVFKLTDKDIEQVNPNTLTCPIFQSYCDAELTKKVYKSVPVLVRDSFENKREQNPWAIRFMTMFHMAGDSNIFQTYQDLVLRGFELRGTTFARGEEQFVPLYEAKMIHQFNHRHGDFADVRYHRRAHRLPSISNKRLQNFHWSPLPYYWVPKASVEKILNEKGWGSGWLMGWRDVTDARASARTLNAAVIPRMGVNHLYPLVMSKFPAKKCAMLLANLNSLVCDYFARQKVGGLHLTYFILKQLPVLPPSFYNEADFAFVVPRVLELTYTAWDMEPWAKDLGFEGEPFAYDPDRRAQIRAELDAWYAQAYGLSYDELRYILDPADIEGEDYPSETFRGLQMNELEEFGEYRTRRLVLEAWDRLHQQDQAPESDYYRIAAELPDFSNISVFADDAWASPASNQRAEAGLQLLSILKRTAHPLPAWRIRMAGALAMEPRLLTSFLTGSEAQQWQRVVGSEARPIQGNISSFASSIHGLWGAAVRFLRSSQHLLEDLDEGTWAPSANAMSYATPEWTDARAQWALSVVQQQTRESLMDAMPNDLRGWIDGSQAA